MKILTNTQTWRHYDADGNQFREGFPRITFGAIEHVEWQLYSATPNAGDPGAVSTWTKDTRYQDRSVGALLSADDTFRKRIGATLTEELPTGPVASLTVAVSDDAIVASDIPGAGTLTIYDNSGNTELLGYVSRLKTEGGFYLTLNTGSAVTGSYPAGTKIELPEALYMQGAMNNAESNPATGLFVFDILADSEKLRSVMLTGNNREAPNVKGLELAIFELLEDGKINEADIYLVNTFSIPNSLADLTKNLAAAQDTSVVAIVNLLLAAGLEVESKLEDEKAYIRIRLETEGGAWSAWAEIPRGPEGPQGIQGDTGKTWRPSIDEEGVLSWTLNQSETQPEDYAIPVIVVAESATAPTVTETNKFVLWHKTGA